MRCSKSTQCLWSTLLTVTVSACVILLYGYFEIKDNYQPDNTEYPLGISAQAGKLSGETCTPTCDSKECVLFAKYILTNMKSTADPCENIHSFACGNYEDKFSAEERSSVHYDSETYMFKIIDDILKNIHADPESASGKLKIIYDSCMNYVSSEKHAFPAARSFLADIGIPDWPNLPPDFRFPGTDVPTLLGNLKAGGEIIFLMFMVPKREPSYDYVPMNVPVNMTMRIDIRYFDNLLREPVKSTFTDILNYFDLDSEAIDVIWEDYNAVRNTILEIKDGNCRDIDEVVWLCKEFKEIEKEMCEVVKGACAGPYSQRENWFGETYTLRNCLETTLSCSDSNEDSTHICKFVDVFLNSSLLSERINKDFIKIEEGDEHFVSHIIPALQNFTDRTLANFFALNFYLNHLGELNFYFQVMKDKYFHRARCELHKPSMVMDRWRMCSMWLANNMHLAVEYEFQKNFLTLQEVEKMLDYLEGYKSELADLISRQDWLSEVVKKIVKRQKVSSNLEILKGYQLHPEEYENSINEYYKMFRPKTNNFFQNVLELKRAASDIHRLLSSIDHHLQNMKFETLVYYSCEDIEYHFGKLSPPNYIPGLPSVLNRLLFAVFGAHELGHHIHFAFGYFFENATRQRELCIENQYSQFKYHFTSGHWNGEASLSENIADRNYALVLDKIIEKYISSHEDILLPGFNSSRQLLYLVPSQLMCTKTSELEERISRITGYASFDLRLIGPMQNSKGFPEAFNCPEGSYMNPSSKCSGLIDNV